MSFIAGFFTGMFALAVVGLILVVLLTRSYQQEILPLDDEENE